MPSVRADAIMRRSYNRPLNVEGTAFETNGQTFDRLISHYKFLIERQTGKPLTPNTINILTKARTLFEERAILPSGRIMFLGGTDLFMSGVEICTFACTFTFVETVHDLVDCYWAQLNGCGVGAHGSRVGSLYGFAAYIPELKIMRSERGPNWKGNPNNHEYYEDGVWTIQVGDSAIAWSKFVGKLVAGKHLDCERLVVDLTNIRGKGNRLRGYGWISCGDEPLAILTERIFDILNGAAGRALKALEIDEIINMVGDSLSTRRAAQMLQCDAHDTYVDDFRSFKLDKGDKPWKMISNNSVNYYERPSKEEWDAAVRTTFNNKDGEPGFRNMETARKRHPWCWGTNPCSEIILPNKGLCNLFEVNIAHPRFRANFEELYKALEVAGYLNYVNTCVDLRDGVLQTAWHENNQNLRLCGVGLAGIAQRPDLCNPEELDSLRWCAWKGAKNAAINFGTPIPQAVTTIKPGGTLPKVMDCSEGMSVPLGEFVFNRVSFHSSDPVVEKLRAANYEVVPHPFSPHNAVLVTLPTHFPGITKYDTSPIEQLNLYKLLMDHWCDHNASCSIYYKDEEEFLAATDWLYENWDSWIAVSMFPREDTSAYAYLPQEAVTADEYDAYVNQLKPVDFGSDGEIYDDDELEKCKGGICPVR